jgi:hypothetical protein
VFFVELVYERSKDVFQRLGVQQLPFVFHWGPDAVVREGRSIKIPKSSEVRAADTLSRCGVGCSAECCLFVELLLCCAAFALAVCAWAGAGACVSAAGKDINSIVLDGNGCVSWCDE